MKRDIKQFRLRGLWFVIRVLLFAGIIPSTPSVAFQASTTQLLTLLLGGLLIWGVAALWVYFAPDESIHGSMVDLFLFTPLWPPRRFACAIWVLIGTLIVTGSIADIVEGRATHRTLSEPLICLVLGLILIGLSVMIYSKKRHRIKGV
jgi:hypothetical protein